MATLAVMLVRNLVFTQILRDSAETPKNPVSLTVTRAQR